MAALSRYCWPAHDPPGSAHLCPAGGSLCSLSLWRYLSGKLYEPTPHRMFGLTYVTALILFLTSKRSVPCLQFSLQAPPGLQLQVPLSSNCSLDYRGGYYQPESGRTPNLFASPCADPFGLLRQRRPLPSSHLDSEWSDLRRHDPQMTATGRGHPLQALTQRSSGAVWSEDTCPRHLGSERTWNGDGPSSLSTYTTSTHARHPWALIIKTTRRRGCSLKDWRSSAS